MKSFDNIESVAEHLRMILGNKKMTLLFAYNGTGKTRLSMAFKEQGKKEGGNDTLYFNAFTEDLFTWDNDLEGDSERVLYLNYNSRFFTGFKNFEMERQIRAILNRYADFDFQIDVDKWIVRFSRQVRAKKLWKTVENIKVSRGEENLFIWCFFLAAIELAMNKDTEAYSWVKYVYIDDPISSLDENNAVAVGHHLAQLLKKDEKNHLKMVISSHHPLFFNVMCNEFGKANKYLLIKNKNTDDYSLKDTGDTPFFYHVAMLAELHRASQSGDLYTYHFSILRSVLEKTASFHGYRHFSDCINQEANAQDGMLYARIINMLSHGNYSLYEPTEMLQENKDIFEKVLDDFLKNYKFNIEIFPKLARTEEAT